MEFGNRKGLKLDRKPEKRTLRSGVKQNKRALRWQEINVKKHENYMQFILVPGPVKRNSLSIEAMKELRDAFLLAKKDSSCQAVLLNSSGTFFCTGIDLSQLIRNDQGESAFEMAEAIKDLVLTISEFSKPVVAAVNGLTVGLGVTLLTLFDVKLASDKAVFHIPATKLGYMPVGASAMLLPQVVGTTMAKDLMLNGRKLNANQAFRHGLVSEVIEHSKLMNEVVVRMNTVISQSLPAIEATKIMVRSSLLDRLNYHINCEQSALPSLWLKPQTQENIKNALETGWIYN